MASLNTHVHVDGVWYGPGFTVPGEVAARITNPHVWDGDPPTVPEPDASTKSVPERSVDAETPVVKQPPRKGPGSGGPAWIEYAASKGVTETFGSKDELIAALSERGLLDEE